MANVLLTGGTGFIGTHLIKALEKRGDTLFKLPHEELHNPFNLDYFIHQVSPTYIFHLASYGNMHGQNDAPDIFSANLAGTFNLLQATKDIAYKAFINMSSSSVKLPHATMYSATKKGAEALCKAYADEYEKPIISFRPYSVYGPGEQASHLIPTVFHSCIYGSPMKLSPKSVHDFVYIDDVVIDLFLASIAVTTGDIIGSYNCGTGIPTTNERLVSLIEEITGKKANIVGEYDLRNYDSDKWVANTLDGDKISLQEGLRKYYEWYQKQGPKA